MTNAFYSAKLCIIFRINIFGSIETEGSNDMKLTLRDKFLTCLWCLSKNVVMKINDFQFFRVLI